MKYASVLLLVLAPLAFANPIVLTLVNEFGFDGQGLGWVELHGEPPDVGLDLTGWCVTTNTSVCTLACTLAIGGFHILDSASLAGGTSGHGAFRLDPAGDHIRLLPPSGGSSGDSVSFPVLPARHGRAPMPPYRGSSALLDLDDDAQFITWYIDSTPTPGQDNDDYSSVAGTVTWPPSRGFNAVEITVSGPMGRSPSMVAQSGQSYLAQGLSAGEYEVMAVGHPGNVVMSYPESVDVGYSAILAGINFDFDPYGLQEGFRPLALDRKPAATVLSGEAGFKRLASSIVFDAMGRRVAEPRSGIFFVRGEGQGAGDVGRTRKVVITK